MFHNGDTVLTSKVIMIKYPESLYIINLQTKPKTESSKGKKYVSTTLSQITNPDHPQDGYLDM